MYDQIEKDAPRRRTKTFSFLISKLNDVLKSTKFNTINALVYQKFHEDEENPGQILYNFEELGCPGSFSDQQSQR